MIHKCFQFPLLLWSDRNSTSPEWSQKFKTLLPHFLMDESTWTECPTTPPVWALEKFGVSRLVNGGHYQSMSCQGNGNSAICATAASSVGAGVCELLAVVLWLFVRNGGQETQSDWVPFLWQQHEQEAQADDAGGSQSHHTEDYLMFQKIYS